MKKSNIFVLGGGLVIGAWAYYVTATTGEQVWMKELHYRAGYSSEIECTLTEGVEGVNWMVCGGGGSGQGAAWAQVGEDEKGPVWAPGNYVAREALASIQQLPQEDRVGLATVRAATPADTIPLAPWDKLN